MERQREKTKQYLGYFVVAVVVLGVLQEGSYLFLKPVA